MALGLPAALTIGWLLGTPPAAPPIASAPGGAGGMGPAPQVTLATSQPVTVVGYASHPPRPGASAPALPSSAPVSAPPPASAAPSAPVTSSPSPPPTLILPPVPTPTDVIPPPSPSATPSESPSPSDSAAGTAELARRQ